MRRSTVFRAGGLGLLVLLGLWADRGPPPAEVTGPWSEEPEVPDARRRAHVAPSRAAVPEAGPAEAGSVAAPYWTDRLVVRAAAGVDLAEVAAGYGLELLRRPGPSGLAVVSVPPGGAASELLAALQDDPRVERAGVVGRIYGAGVYDEMTYRASAYQWHLMATRAPLPGDRDVSEWVVAVLDTGVAYEDHTDGGVTYVQAPSLAGSAIVEPYDFVNGDEHAGDDHQHGTHIASLIASEGDVEGVAPGVSLMPLKVLDQDNSGDEIALIDAIYHAVDGGADVINMSLSFPLGYVPSQELLDAIQYADDSDVIMVAAAGNDDQDAVTWPAASRLVIAVAGGRPGKFDSEQTGGWDKSSTWLADYSNRGAGIDITAPGGALNYDRTGDGLKDGLMAETIGWQDPSVTEYWFYSGSSQATALVTGTIVHLLDVGADPDQVSTILQYASSQDGYTGDRFSHGGGAGGLRIEEAVKEARAGGSHLQSPGEYHAAILPYLRQDGSSVRPMAKVTILNDSGNAVDAGWVYGTLWGSDGGASMVTCKIASSDGSCTIDGGVASSTEVAWAFTIDGYTPDGKRMVGPSKALFATDGGEILLSAMDNTSDLDGAVLAFYWSGATDPKLGALAESYTVINSGTGLSSSPLGLVFRARAISTTSTVTTVSVNLDGAGLSSSPLGYTSVRKVSFTGGTGLSSSPLGYRNLRLAAVDGTGLSSSPLGFHPLHMTSRTSGTGLSSSPLGLKGQPLLLGPQKAVGVTLTGTSFGALLAGEGLRTPDGYEGAAHLLGSGVVDAGWTLSDLSGSSAQTGAMDMDGYIYRDGVAAACTISVTSASWSSSTRKVTVRATSSDTSATLSASTSASSSSSKMTWSSSKGYFEQSVSASSKPSQVTVTSTCGGSATLSVR